MMSGTPYLSGECGTIDGAERCANTPRPLTHSLDLSKEGLAMKATRPRRPHTLGPGTRKLPFWDRVNVINDWDSCWQWKAGSQANRRSRMRFEGRDQYVYRIAWQLTNGAIPAGMEICHRCDNPACCRPSHLFVGTHRDNMLDGLNKGIITLPTNSPRGAAHHDATATDEDVAEARRLYAARAASQRDLAVRFGVAQSVIGKWVRGELRPDAGGPITKRGSRGRETR